jgi:O-antigen/teichoic acid export membrane protein
VAIYSVVLTRILHREQLLGCFRWPVEIPWGEILTFTIPLLSTDLLHLLNHGMDAVLLGYFSGAESVAALRAIRPTAVLNEIVFTSFAILYTPQAARLFARRDAEGVNHLYWQSAAWIAILTLPVFLLTFSLAGPVTEFLFGVRYEQSGVLLAVLALGYYVQAAFGFNGTTLTIYRRVRYVAAMNLGVAVTSITLSLLLIPRYGALGAAIATSTTLILHNIFKQVGLLLFTDVRLFDRRYLRIYAVVLTSAAVLLAVQSLAALPVFVAVGLAAILSLATIWLTRDLLDVERTFPELLRLPFMPRLLGRAG